MSEIGVLSLRLFERVVLNFFFFLNTFLYFVLDVHVRLIINLAVADNEALFFSASLNQTDWDLATSRRQEYLTRDIIHFGTALYL